MSFMKIFFLCALSVLCGYSLVHAANPDAESAANSVIGKVGSKEGLQSNISRPLTGDTSMTTYDGQTVFDVTVSCPSSQRFLEVFIGIGGTGDLSQLLVSQDLDMDGSPDYSYAAPFPVSGVCANGVITCDPGTWNNCGYYHWTAGSDQKVSLSSVSAFDLGGCFCINASCGTDLVVNNLPGAQSDHVFTVDLTYTWNGPDITIPCEAAGMKVPAANELSERCRIAYGDNHAGKWIVLYPSGYRFNPLDYIKVPYTYVVIDGDDERQVEWFETTRYADDVFAILLITNGSWYELSQRFNRPVFYADERIIERFKLKASPSVVRQSGNLMEVTEVAVKQKEDDKGEAH